MTDAKKTQQELLLETCVEFMKEDLKQAVEVQLAYLHLPFLYQDDSDPLAVEFCYDTEGLGVVASLNICEHYLEYLNDSPESYEKKIPILVKSLRALADEIEKISNNADRES